jgi:hypothetical protein
MRVDMGGIMEGEGVRMLKRAREESMGGVVVHAGCKGEDSLEAD